MPVASCDRSRREVALLQISYLTPGLRGPTGTPQPTSDAEEMANKLYVGNLSYNTTSEELQQAFSQAGSVVEAVVMMDKMTGRSRGFGFVTIADQESANKAIEMYNGKDFGGRAIVVNEARPREQRAPRSDRGGMGGGGFGGGY